MGILGLGYVGVESPNAKAWLDFGPEVLGMQVADEPVDGVLLRVDDRNHRLAVRHGEHDRLAYIGWELQDRGSWEDTVERLRSAGSEVAVDDGELAETRRVLGVATVTGPDEFVHELYYGQEFHPDFRPGRSMKGGFVAGNWGLGHAILFVPELSRTHHSWLTDTLGFGWFGQGMSRSGAAIYRSRLNDRSHCLGYAAIPGHRGLHHLGIEVEQLDDVGVAWDLVQERELPIHMSLGKHTQDPVISFYVYTPSGFIVEYFWTSVDDLPHPPVEKKPRQLSLWGHKRIVSDLPTTIVAV